MKKNTHEQFMEKFLKTKCSQTTEIIGEYKTKRDKIKCKCKLCGKEVDVVAGELLRKARVSCCKQCSTKLRNDIYLTHEQFMEKFYKSNNKKLEVVGIYKNSNTKIKCKCLICGEYFEISPDSILKGCGHKKCNCYIKDKLTQEEFLEKIPKKVKEKFKIGEYTNERNNIECICKRCGEIFYRKPRSLIEGKIKCPNCNSVDYENSLAYKRPDLIKYFKDSEKAKWVTLFSNKKIELICPDCGSIIYQICANFVKHGFYCRNCASTLSIGNKIIRSLCFYLKENNFIKEFELEYRPINTKYPYDAFMVLNNGKQILWEFQGRQHYQKEKVKGSIFNREEIFQHDKIKKEYAINNGYIFIEIDCKESDIDYIINNIKESEFKFFININKINWKKALSRLEDTKITYLCNYYENNKDKETIKQMASCLKIDYGIFINKLRIGHKLGICSYNKKRKNKKSIKNTIIRIYDLNNKILGEFENYKEAMEFLKLKNRKKLDYILNGSKTHRYENFIIKREIKNTQ